MQTPFLFVLDHVEMVARKLGDLVEVEGVKAGDRVVLSPPEKLRDGAAVALLKK